MKNLFCNIFISEQNQILFNLTEQYIIQYNIIERSILLYIDNEEYLITLKEKINELNFTYGILKEKLKRYNFNIKKINNNLVKISLMEPIIVFNKRKVFDDLKKYDKPSIMRKYEEGEVSSDDK